MNVRKKFKQIVGISLSVAAAVALTGCKEEEPTGGGGTGETTEYTVTFNVNGGTAINSKVVNSGSTVSKPTDPTKTGYEFKGWYKDAECTQAYDFTSAVNANITLYAKWEVPAAVYKVTFVNGEETNTVDTVGGKATKPADPSKGSVTVNHKTTSYTFDGWYNGDTKFDFNSTVTENLTLTAKFTESVSVEDGYEAVQFFLDIASLSIPAGDVATNISSKGFIVEAGVAGRGGRSKPWAKTDYSSNADLANCDLYEMNDGQTAYSFTDSVKITKSAGIKFTANGSGVCKVYAQNGSDSAGELVYVTVKNLTDDTSVDLAIPGKVTYNSPVTQLSFEVEDGKEYQVLRRDSGTIDVYGVELDSITQVSEEVGINIDMKGTEQFFAGTKFNTNGLSVVSVKQSGATNPLTSEDYTVQVLDSNSQVVDTANAFAAAGTYTVSIKYKEFEAKTYSITVYDLDSIDLGKNVTIPGANNGYNGTYINHTLQQVYGLNDTLDLDGLTIYALAAEGAYSEKIAVDAVQISDVDMTTAGEKEVTITLTLNGVDKSESFIINVVDTAVCTEVVDEVTYANIYVDTAYTGTIGAKTTVGSISKECNTFKTIQQALDYLGMQSDLDSAIKNIYLAAGTYNEKLEITLPGTKLIGIMGAEKTKIEWDSVYGIEDEGGYSQVTDSTATVAVRRSASNVTIKGITVSNYYNNIGAYADLGGAYVGNGERGLALLVQSDMFIMEDGKLLGWQDTLETFTGRQYFKNTYICGCVDFIFGTNSTTYFEECNIEAVKGKASITTEDKTAAYVTAYKGVNQSGTTINYGAIFNNCNFTTSDDFIGKVALARPWATDSTVAFLNSTFSDKYLAAESTTIATGLIKDNNVSSLNIKIYNNKYADGTDFVVTDDLTEVDTTLTAEQAANYTTIATIFGTDNKGVQWNTAWDPAFTGVVVDKNVYYNFTKTPEATGTNINLGTTAEDKVTTGNTLEKDGLTIDCTSGSAAWNENGGCYNFKPGSKIKLHVDANSTVKVAFFNASYAAGASINGFYSSTDTLKQFFAEATDVEIVVTGDTYIKQIAVLADQDAPSTATVESLTVSGYPTSDILVGEEVDLSELKVKANYSDNTYKNVTDFTTDAATAIDNTVAGEYTVTVTYSGVEKQFTVKYVAELSTGPVKSLTYDFSKLETIPASGEVVPSTNEITFVNCYSHDGSQHIILKENNAVKINLAKGAILTVAMKYSSGDVTVNGEVVALDANSNLVYTATAEGEVTISGVAGKAYIQTITVVTPVKSLSYDFSKLETIPAAGETVQSTDEITFVNCLSHDGSQHIILKENNAVKIYLAEGAILTVGMKYSSGDVTVNGEVVALDANSNLVYTATAEGEVTISGVAGKAYIQTITVVTPVKSLSYDFSKLETIPAAGETVQSTDEITFVNCLSHDGSQHIILKENNAVKIYLAAGATLTVGMKYSSGDVTVNGEVVALDANSNLVYTATVDGEVTISGVAGKAYIQTITVAMAS
ncbi:MAG: pectinesterase family protein [Anaeroplasmataceae bacterium]